MNTNLNNPQTPPDPAVDLPAVLTVEELAALLRINRNTAYKYVHDGTVPGVRRIGTSLRISRAAVLEWLRQGRIAPRRKRDRCL